MNEQMKAIVKPRLIDVIEDDGMFYEEATGTYYAKENVEVVKTNGHADPIGETGDEGLDDLKREWWNKGYLKGREDAHKSAKEVGLPKRYDNNLQPNRPKASDNLEEAAEKYAKQYAKETKPKDADGEIWKVGDVMIENQMSFEDGFKAGAQWMAGQGVILNLSIDEFSCGAYNACVEQGLTSEDDVIIQVRKV